MKKIDVFSHKENPLMSDSSGMRGLSSLTGLTCLTPLHKVGPPFDGYVGEQFTG